jgi:Putative MetA-pathway of phenol degradation
MTTSKNFSKTMLATVLVAASLSGAACAADPEVTPYRPGVGSPAVLSATGYFELEAGYDYVKVRDLRTDNFGLLLKYGLTDNVGLLFGVSPYARVKVGGESESGVSDASLGLKFVSKMNDTTALGLQLVSTLPTGSRLFRSDNPNVTLTGLAGFDYSGFHSDINLGVTRFGDGVPGVSRNRFNWSASIGRALSGPVSGALEVSGTRQSGISATQVLGSLAYAVDKRLVLDAYVARARSEGINGTGFGVGLTYLFAK